MRLYIVPGFIDPESKDYWNAELLRSLAVCAEADGRSDLASSARRWADEIETQMGARLQATWEKPSSFDPAPTRSAFAPHESVPDIRRIKIDGHCRLTADFDRALELAERKPFIEIQTEEVLTMTMIAAACRLHRETTPEEEDGARSGPN